MQKPLQRVESELQHTQLELESLKQKEPSTRLLAESGDRAQRPRLEATLAILQGDIKDKEDIIATLENTRYDLWQRLGG